MEAIIYIGHGSRVAEGNEQFTQFIEKVKKRISTPIQEIAFLEKAEPTLLDAVDRCAKQGATIVTVVPVFLFAAGHVKIDLPEQLNKVNKIYPHITFSCTEPISPERSMVDILLERLVESRYPIHDNTALDDTTILIVGRGSSDISQKKDFLKIRAALEEKCSVQAVDYCFLAASDPSFIDGLKIALSRPARNVYVIPYLLFTGVLMHRMKKMIAEISANTNKNIVLTNSLGYHPKLVDIIVSRTQSTILV